jgi:hypothetical protein
MLRANQKAANAKANKLIAAIKYSILVRRSKGARASANDRDRMATTSAFPQRDISMRRVTMSD